MGPEGNPAAHQQETVGREDGVPDRSRPSLRWFVLARAGEPQARPGPEPAKPRESRSGPGPDREGQQIFKRFAGPSRPGPGPRSPQKLLRIVEVAAKTLGNNLYSIRGPGEALFSPAKIVHRDFFVFFCRGGAPFF